MVKTTPPSLVALGRGSLPETIEVDGRPYTRRRIFKNDFFAVTAMYEGEAGKVLLKVGRQAGFLLIPLGWLGRLLAARERAAFQRLHDVDGVPRFIGRWGTTGILREYIEGHPLSRGERVPDDFHPRLVTLIERIHQHGMAYVDLEKPENVLVGDDGKPYLFDFQISWNVPARWGGELWPARVLRGWLQEGDRYHLLKLQRRTRPDQLTDEAAAASRKRPWYLRSYGIMTRPITRLRRRILSRSDPRPKDGERGTVDQEQSFGAP